MLSGKNIALLLLEGIILFFFYLTRVKHCNFVLHALTQEVPTKSDRLYSIRQSMLLFALLFLDCSISNRIPAIRTLAPQGPFVSHQGRKEG